jgi:hypothetical protein
LALLSSTIFIGSHGVASGAEDEFREWHDREHVPERMAMPGFLRARRYSRTVDGAPVFLNVMELRDPETLKSREYRASSENPTEWTRRMVPRLQGLVRGLLTLTATRGVADGGHLVLARDVTGTDGGLDVVASRSAIVGVHLCRGTFSAASDAGAVPADLLLIETATRGAAEDLRAALISEDNRDLPRPAGQVDVYQFETSHRPA